MNPINSALSAALITLIIYCILQIILFRLLSPKRRWPILKNLVIITSILFTLIVISLYDRIDKVTLNETFASLLYGAFVLFVLLCGGFLIFYVTIDRSISLRTMEEFRKTGNHSVEISRLLSIYSPQETLERRLNILCDNKYLIKTAECYRLSAKGKAIALITRSLKNFLKLGDGG